MDCAEVSSIAGSGSFSGAIDAAHEHAVLHWPFRRSSGVELCWSGQQDRLQVRHGPIDIVLSADGPGTEKALAFEQALQAFDGLLESLVSDLPILRTDINTLAGHVPSGGDTATVMREAVQQFRPEFVTPMAAVAGAVADTVLAAMTRDRELHRASVNNGGDIALMLSPGSHYRVGLCDNLGANRLFGGQQALAGHITLSASDDVRGVATSGWQGRSVSMGIADAVTVLAASAAQADVAATLIANHVVPDTMDNITRLPANELDPDSDLAGRAVTTGVGILGERQKTTAVNAGAAYAKELCARELVTAAWISVQGVRRSVTHMAYIPDRQRSINRIQTRQF